ncbi:unnamed protein product [Aphanomyces euteiches]|nr:hypothetical protein AeRB84_020738 [Aphanomyces euteiches]
MQTENGVEHNGSMQPPSSFTIAMRVALVSAAIVAAAVVANAAVVVWDNTQVVGDVVVGAGQSVVLRNRNVIRGQLSIAAGGSIVADPTTDVYLEFANLEINGTLAIGSSSALYTKTATLAFNCECPSRYPAADDRRYGINVRSGGRLQLYGAKGTTLPWTRLAANAFETADCITLADDVAAKGWTIGDTIVITSTDFDPFLTERRTITGFRSTCVEIDSPLRFMHYGDFAQGVDQRAEVGLLDRSIRLVGCTNNGNIGGHAKFNPGFASAQLHGVGVQYFGQGDIIGRYPIHFHVAGNVAATQSFVNSSAVYDSNMRAITIHGTQSVVVERNVAYNITGHAIFLEDGAEFNNTFRRNLVAMVRQKASGAFRLGSDALAGLSGFWITNADNTFQDNVVAGVEGSAYWLHTRAQAKLLSFRTGLYPNLAPYLVPFRLFDGNRAHSVWNGFRIDSVDFDADDEPTQDYGGAVSVAYQPTALTLLSNFLVHHARQGGWFRIFEIVLDRWQVADCQEGIQFLTTGNTATIPINGTVRNSHFVGSSSNRGNQYTSAWQSVNYVEARSQSAMLLTDINKMGITLYDGPHYIENTVFENYISYPCFNYYTPAFGARAFNTFMMASTTRVTNVSFINTDYRFFMGDRVSDGGKTTLIQDQDGSISGQRGAVVLPDWDFYYTPTCIRNASYGLACPQRYNNIEIVQIDGDANNVAKYGELYVLRTDVDRGNPVAPGLSFQGQYIPAAGGYLYHPSLSVGATYAMSFTKRTPQTLRVNLVNGKRLDTHTIAVCYPAGTRITSVVDALTGQSIAKASTLKDTSCVNCFFYDTTTAVLMLRLQQRNVRANPNFPCPATGCEGLIVQASNLGATLGVSDCTTRAAPLLLRDSAWMQTSFSDFESFSLNLPINLDWCRIGDPCLEAIDVGNREIGILAYSDPNCNGIGCYSSKCRYCKLSFSQSQLPFLPCPFETKAPQKPVTAAPTTTPPASRDAAACSSLVSTGDTIAGISAIPDTTCATSNNTTGCFLSKCRFCMAQSTPQSRIYQSCSAAPPTCADLVSDGDKSGGVSAVTDLSCPTSTLAGCFRDTCRFCQVYPTKQSWHFAPCPVPETTPAPVSTTSSPTQTPRPSTTMTTARPTTTIATTTVRPTTAAPSPPTTTPTPAIKCTVSPGDANIGLSAFYDPACAGGGLGCYSGTCRFCQAAPTTKPATYMPCPTRSPSSNTKDAVAMVQGTLSHGSQPSSMSFMSSKTFGVAIALASTVVALVALFIARGNRRRQQNAAQAANQSVLTDIPGELPVVEVPAQSIL